MADPITGSVRNGAGSVIVQTMTLNEKDEQLGACGLPRGVEMVRQGNAAGTMSTAAAAGRAVRPPATHRSRGSTN